MIEKLVTQKLTIAGKKYEYPDTTALVGKINELVDAVNGILDYAPLEMAMKAEPEDKGYIKLDNDSLQKFLKAHPEYNNKGVIEIPKKEPADPYAEQRKWIGKVCWFWDEEEEEKIFGILTTIDSDCGLSDMCPYWNGTTSNWFEHCEPVKPDSEIIYHGE